jgi:hypothetical protein
MNYFFFNLANSYVHTRPWGFTQPQTEMSTRSRKIMFLGSRERPMNRADKITVICEPIVYKM